MIKHRDEMCAPVGPVQDKDGRRVERDHSGGFLENVEIGCLGPQFY